jgi:hypothetical protein
MSHLRTLVLLAFLSPAILATSVAGYRKWASDGFEDPKLPEWLKDAQPKKDSGPGNLMEKTLGRHRRQKCNENAPADNGVYLGVLNEDSNALPVVRSLCTQPCHSRHGTKQPATQTTLVHEN